MASQTTNFGMIKDAGSDYYSIDTSNGNLDIIDKGLIPYIGVTSGSANTYTIITSDIKSLSTGIAICIKFNIDSTGASTLNINGLGAKPLKKVNGSNATNLKAAGIYTLRYDGTSFILQGEGASGNASASDLLSGKTATTDVGEIEGSMSNNGPVSIETINLTTEGAEYTIPKGYHSGLRKIKAVISGLIASVIKAGAVAGGIEGTFTADATATDPDVLSGKSYYRIGVKGNGSMPNNGAVNHALPINGSYTIPAGYHSGSGKVTQTIATKGAATYSPSTVAQKIPAGQYLSGDQTIAATTGTATAADVLAPKTFDSSAGIGAAGTMPNNGAVNHSLAANGSYTIPAGYHNGSGKVTQALTTKAAATITPGTADQVIAAGQYLSGAQTIKGDPDLVAGNIPEDMNFFNVQGTRKLGKKFASGTGITNGGQIVFTLSAGGTSSMPFLKVTGLDFTPSTIILTNAHTQDVRYTIYCSAISTTVVRAILTTGTNYIVSMQGNAYVTLGGFQLPVVHGGNENMIWLAFE